MIMTMTKLYLWLSLPYISVERNDSSRFDLALPSCKRGFTLTPSTEKYLRNVLLLRKVSILFLPIFEVLMSKGIESR